MAKKSPFPFMKKAKGKKKQKPIAKAIKGKTTEAPYGIGTDMKQSPNY
jgi:hypothetical protein